MGFENMGQMATIVSNTLMDLFLEVLSDSLYHLRWNCVDFISDSFLQILKISRTMYGITKGMRPVPPLYASLCTMLLFVQCKF